MKLYEVEIFLDELKSYWLEEIDSIEDDEEMECENIDELKDDLEIYINDLHDLYINYASSDFHSLVESMLESLFVYIINRHKLKMDEGAPELEQLVDDEDLRTLFLYWTYEFDTNYGEYFSIVPKEPEEEEEEEEGEEETNKCEIVKESKYKNTYSALSSAFSEDSSQVKSFVDIVPKKNRPVNIYRLYKKPEIKVHDINERDFALNDMNLQKILDTFEIEIKGVNE